jgi:hypothetical protein
MHTNPTTDTSDAATGRTTARRGRRIAAAGLTAGVLGGAAIGLWATAPSSTSAASPTAAVSAIAATDDAGDVDTVPGRFGDDVDPAEREARITERIRTSLQTLVDDGTIDAAQADAVAERLAREAPDRPMRGERGERRGHPAFDGEVVADLIGIDADELLDSLRDGATIADVAAANAIDPQTVIDALVAEAESHLDLAVENGRLTEDEAADRLDQVTDRITQHVEEGRPGR